LAIEHTIVETFSGRKLDDARFLKIFASLEREVKDAFPYWTCLWIPTFAIQPGTNWDIAKSSICAWLWRNVPDLPEGRTKHQVSGVPFSLTVEKRTSMPPGFWVGRLTPAGEDGSKQLVEKFCAALADKNDQLQKYRASGAETILLAESDDIALVSLPTLYQAFLLAWDRTPTPNICQVWMAHTHAPDNWCEIVCFLGPDEIMNKVNPANYGYGPRYRDKWFSGMREEKFAGIS
jgi:hypothetical protein